MDIESIEDQLIVKPPVVEGSKWEAVCHLCPWSFHKFTEEEARSWLREHVVAEHLTPYVDTFMTGTSLRKS